MSCTTVEAFARLRLPSTASETEIRAKFIQLSQRYPEVVFPDRFLLLKEAYEVLTDTGKRFEELFCSDKVDLQFLKEAMCETSRRYRFASQLDSGVNAGSAWRRAERSRSEDRRLGGTMARPLSDVLRDLAFALTLDLMVPSSEK